MANLYRMRSDGSVKSKREIRALMPNVSFPGGHWTENACDLVGCDLVHDSTPPSSKVTQTVELDGAEESDGKYKQKWKIVNLPDDEAASAARSYRSNLLAQTDYLALADSTLTQEMRDYRQSLRDVPSQSGFPHDITWPSKPE